MAFLTKEQYEGKQRAAERRMTENAKKETLTEEQHDALSWLCMIRHEMHGHQEAFFHEESSDHTKFWNYIDTDINERLTKAGLSKIEFEYDELDDYNTDGFVISDLDDEDIDDDDEREERIAEALEEIIHLAETFNTTIEDYLREIDEEHGTSYCPTGISRLF